MLRQSKHRAAKPIFIILIILTAICFAVAIVFNVLQPLGIDNVFKNDVGNLSDKYVLSITPSGATFSIWGLIYVFQALWILYTITLIFRTNKRQTGELYYDPPFLPGQFYVIYIINLCLNVTWLFSFDSEFLVASFVALFGIAMSLYVCLFFSFRYLWRYESELTKAEMIVNIILVQNGLGFYATWTTVATLLNFGIVLRYVIGVAMETTSYIVLTIILAIFLIVFFSEILILTRRMRYFFAHYIILIVALTGVYTKNWNAESGVQIYNIVILAIVAFTFLVKIIVSAVRGRHDPTSIEK